MAHGSNLDTFSGPPNLLQRLQSQVDDVAGRLAFDRRIGLPDRFTVLLERDDEAWVRENLRRHAGHEYGVVLR